MDAKKLHTELREIKSLVEEAVFHVIETRQADDFQQDALEKALTTLTTVRYSLADAIKELASVGGAS